MIESLDDWRQCNIRRHRLPIRASPSMTKEPAAFAPARCRNRLSERESGGFCCPAPPGAAEFPSVARWVQPRYFRVMSGREALNYAAMASASLSLALVSFAQFNGLHGPGKNIAFEHTSILVRPHQTPRHSPQCGLSRDMWWNRRVLPPGPLRLLYDTIYHHSRANPARSIWNAARHLSSLHECQQRPDRWK